jgi:pimeloyl-ACP methyl ester carboxylesterase
VNDSEVSGARSIAPTWFSEALQNEPVSARIEVTGCDIHYLRWGPAESSHPGILFLHAGGAHARWWSFIAPFFAQERPVAALDFSGMGDSGWRDSYGSAKHVAEIAAVLRDARLGDKPVVVGHSFGGFMAMCHGNKFGESLTGIVFVDTPLRPPTDTEASPVAAYTRPVRYYPDQETMLSRFKLGPAQPCANDFILDYIARHSVAERPQGWAWKFDVAARGADHHEEPLADYVRNLGCQKALIYGAKSSMVSPDVVPYLVSLFEPDQPVVCVPEAHHHLFLEQPIAFVAALRAIVSRWEQTSKATQLNYAQH